MHRDDTCSICRHWKHPNRKCDYSWCRFCGNTKEVMEKFACEVCCVSSHKTATYRVNSKGEPGIFRCEDCLETPPDRDAKELVDIIKKKNENSPTLRKG